MFLERLKLTLMTPQAFVSKWHGVKAKESASAKVHFEDLCTLLGVPSPLEEDPSGTFYTYEKHVRKATGKKGLGVQGQRRQRPA